MHFHWLPEPQKRVERAQVEEELNKWVVKGWPPTVWIPGAVKRTVAQF